jgi:hypothetical protein
MPVRRVHVFPDCRCEDVRTAARILLGSPSDVYADENIVARSGRRCLSRDPGYAVHTPAELYGTREA